MRAQDTGLLPVDEIRQLVEETCMANPIEHLVIIVKEGHPFENCFGTVPGAASVTLQQAPDPQIADPLHDHAD